MTRRRDCAPQTVAAARGAKAVQDDNKPAKHTTDAALVKALAPWSAVLGHQPVDPTGDRPEVATFDPRLDQRAAMAAQGADDARR